ncbi:MAG: GNAT family N-acetyltransferase [Puniceicoccales bacterium]|jgi:RimJ/RimL family protein N-acetyltransferase|nr:GNAT family N-acetyltransferase [Puniceicoccales bacterium]
MNGFGGLENAPMIFSEDVILKALSYKNIDNITAYLSDRETVFLLTYTPYPYTREMAEFWIRHIDNTMARGETFYWSINVKSDFIGTIGLSIFSEHDKAEMHYWIGKPYWGNGYCTAAARLVINYCFNVMKLHRLEVNHMTRNVGSRRVIEKCGFIFESEAVDYVKRFGKYENVMFYRLMMDDVKNTRSN